MSYFLKSLCTFKTYLHHDIFCILLMQWSTLRCYNVVFPEYFPHFLTSWHTFWCHDVPLTLCRTFWRHEVHSMLFNIMMYFSMSDIRVYYTSYLLKSWCIFHICLMLWRTFWRDDGLSILLDVMTYLLTLCHTFFMSWRTIWRSFDVMAYFLWCYDTFLDVMAYVPYFWRHDVLFDIIVYFQ